MAKLMELMILGCSVKYFPAQGLQGQDDPGPSLLLKLMDINGTHL